MRTAGTRETSISGREATCPAALQVDRPDTVGVASAAPAGTHLEENRDTIYPRPS
jgi:hypothetical protein